MARRTNGSQTSLRRANKANLLESIHKFGAMTQIELAEITGLSTGTVSTQVHQLVEEGKLETHNTIRNGRRATLVALSHDQGLGVGLSITRRDLFLVIIDYSKDIIAEHRLPLPPKHKTDTTLERAIRLINETLENAGTDASEIVGIGVALGAPVDFHAQTVAIPGILPGWDGIDIRTPLTTAFHVPVMVDNDANAAAICEARMGAALGKQNFVYIGTNDGVGSGIMVNGDIMHGVTGLAGEIGHIQVDPLGSICSCGNRGCLNTIVDEARLVSLLSVTHGNMTMEDLVQTANAGDPGCRRVIADAAVRIGTVASDLCISVDPEMVVVGGSLAMSGDTFIEPFSETLQRLLFPNALTPIQVLAAQYPDSGSALGAAMMVIELAEKKKLLQG